jgi:hypothetical protein
VQITHLAGLPVIQPLPKIIAIMRRLGRSDPDQIEAQLPGE